MRTCLLFLLALTVHCGPACTQSTQNPQAERAAGARFTVPNKSLGLVLLVEHSETAYLDPRRRSERPSVRSEQQRVLAVGENANMLIVLRGNAQELLSPPHLS